MTTVKWVPNERIAKLISQSLVSGLLHPGDPDNNQLSTTIVLPAFRSTGMPKEMVEQVELTTRMLGEAIVYLIETEGDSLIIQSSQVPQTPSSESASLPIVPVYCRLCDAKRTNPLMTLTLGSRDYVTIDGRQLIKGLSKRSTECPHEMKE